MYTYLDLKIIEKIINTNIGLYKTYHKETLYKLSPFSNVVNIGSIGKVFYNTSLQDFVFISFIMGSDEERRYHYYFTRSVDNKTYKLEDEKTSILREELADGASDVNIKISEDSKTMMIMENNISLITGSSSSITIYDTDKITNDIIKQSINNDGMSFLTGDNWLCFEYEDKKIVMFSDILYNNKVDNEITDINRGIVYFTIVSVGLNAFLTIKPTDGVLKHKTNLLFGNNISLLNDGENISIGVNDLNTLSIKYSIKELIERYLELN